MKKIILKRTAIALMILSLTVMAVSASWALPTGTGNPIQQILALLTDPQSGLAEIKNEIQHIEAKLSPPSLTLSSGLFGLPENAASVDWMVVNNSTTTQTIMVTVFKAGVGPKTAIAPEPLTLTIAPGETTHNANSVGSGEPFTPGFYYEVVVETTDPNVLPSVHVWQDHVNTVIPGTLVPPGSWVRLE